MAKPKATQKTTVTVQVAAKSKVFVDGTYQGLTGADGELALELAAGEHVVLLTQPDSLMQSERFTVTAGQPERLVFETQAAPQVYTTYDDRAGKPGELEGSPGMIWGGLGIGFLFVFVIVLSSRLFGGSER